MRSVWLGCILLILWNTGPAFGQPTSWNQTSTAVQEEITSREAATVEVLNRVELDRDALRKELETVRQQVRQAEGKRLQQQKALENLREETRALRTEILQTEQDLAALEGVSRSVARDAFKKFPVTVGQASEPHWTRARSLLDEEGYPDISQLEGLFHWLMEEIQGQKVARISELSVIGPDGRTHEAPVLSLGPFTRVAEWQGDIFYLVDDLTTESLRMVDVAPSWGERRQLAAFWAGESNTVPFDLSRGAVVMQRAEQGTLTHRLRDGGWVVWPILAIGLIAACLVLERLVVLSRLQSDSETLHREVKQAFADKDAVKANNVCLAHSRNPAARVLGAGLVHAGQKATIVESAFHEAILRQIPAMERFLPTLSVLGAVAPLMGLLGTVTGMIGTFQAITLYGTGNTGLMSGGISEALITTQLGLGVAIPILLLHHFLERRVEKLVDRMEQTASRFAPLLSTDGWRS